MESRLAQLERNLNSTHSKLINLEINFNKSLENALNPDNVDKFFLLIMGMVIFCKYDLLLRSVSMLIFS
jgi:hypothetical protein